MFTFNDTNSYLESNILFGMVLSLFNLATEIWLYFQHGKKKVD